MSDFTTAQQAQIRAFLGYPSLFRYKDTRLEGVIASTGVVDADTVALVVGWIANLVAIDAAIIGRGATAAGVKNVDGDKGVTLYEGRVKKDLWEIGKTFITRISTTFGVPIYSDYYGQSGYPGDNYSGELGRASGRGVIPLG